ncbi:oxalate decarboxylase [Lactarius tabidus]
MSYWKSAIKSAVLFAYLTTAALAAPTSTAPSESATVVPASDNPNYPIFPPGSDVPAQPIRDALGALILGPQNLPLQRENPDLLAPPTTDHGSVQNAKWPFTLSSNRLQTGGWARQQNGIAGVDMRLEPGAIRELHWHKSAEWAYVIKGATQITSVDQDGRSYVANVVSYSTWRKSCYPYASALRMLGFVVFPAGIPHSLQDTGESPDGSEFLLVFPDGDFDEDSTFLITDWLAHVPKEVIAKSLQADITAFDHIPSQELYIFPSEPPSTDVAPSNPQGEVPNPFSFAWSKVNETQYPGGSAKIIDSTTFKISTSIAAAEVTVEPGAIRELHWHPTQDEWTYYLSGHGRVTVFASSSNARTFDYQAGDIGFVPASCGHNGVSIWSYLTLDVVDRFQDISLTQWLALTPPQLVKAHLGLSDETISHLSKTKQYVV